MLLIPLPARFVTPARMPVSSVKTPRRYVTAGPYCRVTGRTCRERGGIAARLGCVAARPPNGAAGAASTPVAAGPRVALCLGCAWMSSCLAFPVDAQDHT